MGTKEKMAEKPPKLNMYFKLSMLKISKGVFRQRSNIFKKEKDF